VTVLAFVARGAQRRPCRRLVGHGRCGASGGRGIAHSSHNARSARFWRRIDQSTDLVEHLLCQRCTMAFRPCRGWAWRARREGRERRLSASPARSEARYAPVADTSLSRGTDFRGTSSARRLRSAEPGIECRINGKLGPRVAAAGPVALRARISRRARQPPNQTSPQRYWRRSAVGYAAAPRTPARQRDLRARAAEAAEGLLPRGDLDREGSIAFAWVSPLSGCTTGACASAPSSKTRSVH